MKYLREIFNYFRDPKRKIYLPLLFVFIFGFFLRCLTPIYVLKTNKYYQDYMIISSYAWDLMAISISLAKGEGIHTNYFQYAVDLRNYSSSNLNEINQNPTGRQLYFDKGGLGPIFISSVITKIINSFNIPIIQIFQGFIDSLGVVLTFGILNFFFPFYICLIGSFLYAICPTFIFYAFNLTSEAYISFFMLVIGYMMILSLLSGKLYRFAIAGALMGLSFGGFRMDNIFILPFYLLYTVWFYRESMFTVTRNSLILILSCLIFILPFKMSVPKNIQNVATIGSALYNSLGEYPGTYKGIRFADDQTTIKYAIEKVIKYSNESPAFEYICSITQKYSSKTTNNDLILFAYIKEVIIEKPFLYADWIIRRFIAYLPSHPFLAYISFIFTNPSGQFNSLGYRFNQLFHTVKYIDFLFFIIFSIGIWLCRKNNIMLSLLCIYFGVLIGHVVLTCGEVYFRNDAEYVFLEPRYLLGMISIWPIFIAVALGEFKNSLFKYRTNNNFSI